MADMSKLQITEGEVTSALEFATQIVSSLESSSATAKTLLSAIEGSKWSGEARNSFLAYLSIVEQFHQDMYKTSKKQKEALQALVDGLADYESNAEVQKVKSL